MALPQRAPARTALSQPARLCVALAYILLLLLLGRWLNGGTFPPFGLAGLWFYSAFGVLILGEFILEPFFTRPADALASSIALVVACASVSIDGAEIRHGAVKAGRLAFVIAGLALTALCVVAITFKDRGGRLGSAARAAAAISGRIGQARWVFSALLFGSAYAAFAHSSGKVAALYLSWFAIVVLAPLEFAWGWWLRRQPHTGKSATGTIETLEDPGIVVAQFPRGLSVQLGMVATVGNDGAQGVVVDSTSLPDQPRARVALSAGRTAAVGERVQLAEP